jgi:uncharacterized protein DUF4232
MTPSANAARLAIATAVLLGSAALAAACGSTQVTSSRQAAAEASEAAPLVSPSVGPGSTASATPGSSTCTGADLKVALLTGSGGAAAGSVYYPLNFTNISHGPCVLDGYPGVSFVTSPSGQQIGSPASKNPAVAPVPVTLAPGATGHATLQVVDAQNYSAATCDPVTAHWLRVYAPGQTTAAEVSFTTMACSAQMAGTLGNPLTVDAIKAGQGQAGAGL